MSTKERVWFCSCIRSSLSPQLYDELVGELTKYAEERKPSFRHPSEIGGVPQPAFRISYKVKGSGDVETEVGIDIAKSKADFETAIAMMRKASERAEAGDARDISGWMKNLEQGKEAMAKPKSCQMKFSVSIDAPVSSSNKEKAFASLIGGMADAEGLLSILGKHKWTYTGKICARFGLGKNNLKTAGVITLPYRIMLDPRTEDLMGEAEVSGLAIEFRDSPIGMKKINIKAKDGGCEFEVQFEYKSKTMEGLLRKNFDIVMMARNTFLGSP